MNTQKLKPPKVSSWANKKPPPIYVADIKEIGKVTNLAEENQIKPTVAIMNKNRTKINVDTSDEFRKLSSLLNTNNIQHHTYENKQERNIRVMIKGIPPEMPETNVKASLEVALDADNVRVTRKLDKKTKEKLSMCHVEFPQNTDIKKIYNLTELDQIYKIRVEPVRSSKLIVQCKRCQEFGHTKNFCGKEPKCVKCGKNHDTKTCTKPNDPKFPPHCANCLVENVKPKDAQHTANWRLCPVALRHQEAYEKSTDTVKPTAVQEQKTRFKVKTAIMNNRRPSTGFTDPNLKSFANIARNAHHNQFQIPAPQEEITLVTVLNEIRNINKRLTALENKLGIGRPRQP